jgi:hypothetical protein
MSLPNLVGVQLTTVGTVPVALAPATGQVYLPEVGQSVAVPGAASGNPSALQQPGPSASDVEVATPTGLWSVPLGGGSPTTNGAASEAGPVGQPVVLSGCTFGVWGGSPGQVVTSCPGSPAVAQSVPGEQGGLQQPVFRVNNGTVMVNDLVDGAAWLIRGTPNPVVKSQDWTTLFLADQSGTQDPSQNGSAASKQAKPTLNNPPMEARAGVQSILHLLDLDTDPNNSPLAITGLDAQGLPPGATVSVTPDQQAVVISLPPAAAGPVTFRYTATDGVGQSADGPVTVNVVGASTETRPNSEHVRDPNLHIVAGTTQTISVLGGWRDNESDPITLSAATVLQGQGQCSWASDGAITYTAPPTPVDLAVQLTYDVTDGRSDPVPHTVNLAVLGSGSTTAYAATAQDDVVHLVAGQTASVSPLGNDLFGADPSTPSASLAIAGTPSASPATPDLSVTTETDGRLALTASTSAVPAGSTVKTYLVPYQDAFGSAPLSDPKKILVVVTAPVQQQLPPVTIPLSVATHGSNPLTADVLASDSDPAGGLLTVTDVAAPSGVEAVIEQGQYLRFKVTDPTLQGAKQPLVVNYQVSDGSLSATGQVFVTPLPNPPNAAPVVPETFATVRAGNVVEVPVLRSASDPAGLPITLVQGAQGGRGPVQLAVTPSSGGTDTAGSASVTPSYLRYAAPACLSSPETVNATFQVAASDGSSATGTTVITVLPESTPSSAPQPVEVDARVAAGGTVTIPVPTTGVDPDGQDITATGIGPEPSGVVPLGRVTHVAANAITYQAYPTLGSGAQFIGGTDQFSYQVVSPTGQSATGIVRIGVTPPSPTPPPVAVDHVAFGAPGGTASIDLLAGAIIAPNDQVKLASFTLPRGASLAGSTLTIPVPSGASPTSFTYVITDGIGSSTAQVSVWGEPGYAPAPRAADFFPRLPSALARTVSVDVLTRASGPTGGPLRVTSPAKGVKITSGGHVVVPVTASPRSVPYVVITSKTHEVAIGVIHMPGRSQTLQLIADRLINVPANGSTIADLTKYVASVTGVVRITDRLGVTASPTAGLSENVVGDSQVKLIGASGYQGPGALVVTVTDSKGDRGAKSTLVIPVTVGNPSPIVRCPGTPIRVVQGGKPIAAVVSSLCQVYVPDGTARDSVRFTPSWTSDLSGVSVSKTDGGRGVIITPDSSAKAGGSGSLHLSVDGGAQGSGGDLPVEVISAPPATVSPYTVTAKTGTPVTVDMKTLVTSPLAQPNITVLSATGPPSAKFDHAGSTVTITPQTGAHGSATINLQVTDDGRPDRSATGAITLNVQDRPSKPTNLQGSEQDGTIVLTWDPAAANGAPLTSYEVFDGGTRIGSPTANTFSVTGLTNGQQHTFTVDAVNAVGTSDRSGPWVGQAQARPGVPPSLAVTPGDGTLGLLWGPTPQNGQPIDDYQVTVSPAPTGGPIPLVPGTSITVAVDNNQGPYSVQVRAHNGLGWGLPTPVAGPYYAHGRPPAPPAPTATGTVPAADQGHTNMVVTWPPVNPCNDAQACDHYTLTEFMNGNKVTSLTVYPASCSLAVCSQDFNNLLNDSSHYTYQVTATNREQDTSLPSASSNQVQAVGQPDSPPILGTSNGLKTASITFKIPASHGARITTIRCFSNGSPCGSWTVSGGTDTTQTENIILNPGTYPITLVAVNDAGKASPPSTPVNVNPYGNPDPPTLSAGLSGATVTFTWNGGGQGGNGQNVTYYLCVNGGACQNVGSGPSNQSVTDCCNKTISATAYVVNQVGGTSLTSVSSGVSKYVPSPSLGVPQWVTTGRCVPGVLGSSILGYIGYYQVPIVTNGIPAQYISGTTGSMTFYRTNGTTGGYGPDPWSYDPAQTLINPGTPGAWGGWRHNGYSENFTVQMTVAGVGALQQTGHTDFPCP